MSSTYSGIGSSHFANAAEQKQFAIGRLLIAAAAFALYAASSGQLAARYGGLLFGADAHLYAPIAKGEVYDRVFRFHPVTVGAAEAWMVLHGFFAAWVNPQWWLRLLFAGFGAASVWLAAGAIGRIVAWRLALLGGLIYALSFSVWFFSSIEESKMVSGALAVLYIALWMRLREAWTVRGAWLLTLVLFLACMNEIVACLLVAIPALDELQRRGFDLRALRWLFAHALIFFPALLILETALPERLSPVLDGEGTSHFSMLFYYFVRNDYGLVSLWSFLLNWFLFSFSAPVNIDFCHGCDVYFAPSLAGYFSSPWRAAWLVWFCAMLVPVFVPNWRNTFSPSMRALLFALAGYSLVRGAFFFVFNPHEAILYTPSVMLPHVMMFLTAFASTRVPAKAAVLAMLAVLLFIANGLFIPGA